METFFYVGTYTQPILFGTGEVLDGRGEGIYCVGLDRGSGKARLVHVNASVPNPSFLCCSPALGTLWAVSELKDYGGMVSGAVSSLRIDPATLELELTGTAATMGADPCYVSADPEAGLLFAANYSSGSLAVFPIGKDGSPGPHCQLIRRTGSGPDAGRQEGPHVHCAVPVPGMNRVMACDLGADRICEYPISAANGRLLEDQALEIAVAPGSGPRHVAFSADGSACYVTMELSSEILVLGRTASGWTALQTADSWDKESGDPPGDRWRPGDGLPAGVGRPGGNPPVNLCADVHLSPDGRFLYCSNRGRDCISVFSVAPDRTLAHCGDFPAHGRTPRSFCLSPAGDYLLCANQDSDCVSIFRVSQDHGGLELTDVLEIPTPVNVAAYGSPTR